VWILGERGLLDNVAPLLVDPEVVNPTVWRGGGPRLVPPSPSMAPDFHGGLQTAEWVMTDLFVNPDVVPPGAITSWQDLLRPEYRGKIASADPRQAGPAWSTVGYLNRLFGPDYLRDLYKGQEVVLTADTRQLAEWVARGTYPIGIALYQAAIEPMKAAGLPLERVYPTDGPGILTGGFGSAMKIKDGPDPAAAAVFLNWWASREAQEMYEGAVQEMSLRADVSHKVPDYIVPRPGVEYRYNAYDPDQHYNQTVPSISALQEIIGR
jgi:iron(III) transport system substrate-binding protein